MKSIHLAVPDLMLPQSVAQEVCAGLSLPNLERWLGKADASPVQADTLEAWLCQAFGIAKLAIAPVTLRADGIDPENAYWLRADPIHLSLQRNKMIVMPGTKVSEADTAQLCATLNTHFAEDGLRFYAPHPQRWYVRLELAPQVQMMPLAQVMGQDAKHFLPQGAAALRWHQVFNEVQMLLNDHPVNVTREAHGEMEINSVWFWGGGYAAPLAQNFVHTYGDSDFLQAFACTAEIEHRIALPDVWAEGGSLCVWEGLSQTIQNSDLYAWRVSLQQLETTWLRPMIESLMAGDVDCLILHVPQAKQFELTRAALWKFWRRSRALTHYALM